MTSRIRIIVRVLVVVGLLWVLYQRTREPVPMAPTSAPVSRGAPVEVAIVSATVAASPSPSGAGSSSVAPGRIRLPRAVVAAAAMADGGAGGAPAPLAPRLEVAELGGKLVDRRGDVGADAPSELELIHAGLDTLRDDIDACLEEWRGTDAQAEGEVMIAFQLDESGLTESWVVRDAELPFGIRTCFANAVYGLDWSHIVRHPAEVSQRFTLEREDAGR